MIAVEFDDNLRYKELTHHQSVGRGIFSRNSHGWTDTTSYKWNKRQMAKLSRRNARVIVAEQAEAIFDYSLYDLLVLWFAYINFLDEMYWRYEYMDFVGYVRLEQPTRGCHCPTCVALRHRPR